MCECADGMGRGCLERGLRTPAWHFSHTKASCAVQNPLRNLQGETFFFCSLYLLRNSCDWGGGGRPSPAGLLGSVLPCSSLALLKRWTPQAGVPHSVWCFTRETGITLLIPERPNPTIASALEFSCICRPERQDLVEGSRSWLVPWLPCY